MKTITELNRLENLLKVKPLPVAKKAWHGAKVDIRESEPPIKEKPGFYPEPRYVVTPYALSVSWLFEKLRDAFYAENRVDGVSKIELFGRFANAANRCLYEDPTVTGHILLAVILHEAYAIYDEMEKGQFMYLILAMGNQIADDTREESNVKGFESIIATLAFFEKRGTRIPLT